MTLTPMPFTLPTPGAPGTHRMWACCCTNWCITGRQRLVTGTARAHRNTCLQTARDLAERARPNGQCKLDRGCSGIGMRKARCSPRLTRNIKCKRPPHRAALVIFKFRPGSHPRGDVFPVHQIVEEIGEVNRALVAEINVIGMLPHIAAQ
jgi:hypothetical protein